MKHRRALENLLDRMYNDAKMNVAEAEMSEEWNQKANWKEFCRLIRKAQKLLDEAANAKKIRKQT